MVAAGVLGSVLGVVPGGLGSGVVEAQSLGAGGVTSHSRAFLHRTVIEEGQTRQFEISNLPDRPAYFVFFKPLDGYTAEASDVTLRVHRLGTGLVEVAPGEGSRASVNSLRERLRFEVEAHKDSPADSDDETFGVQLCTTADCTGGTVLGDWTVTITDVSDTTLTGTGASIAVSGGSTSMMERVTNNDNRDVADTVTVSIPWASRPSQSIVVVGLVDTTTKSKLDVDTPIANIAGSLAEYARVGPATPREAFVIDLDALDVDGNGTVEQGEWVSEYEVPVAAFNNAVDTPGGVLSGNLVFTIYQYDDAYRDKTDCTVDLGLGPQTVKCADTSTPPTPYTGIVLPDVPLTVTGDDEVTEIELHHAATQDRVATEGSSTDTAKFRVTLGRELAAGETLTVPLAFQGATLGTHFTLSLDGSPQGVVYADSSGAETGELAFTGPSAAEATVVVTAAANDSDTATNNLVVRTYPTSEPWKGNHIETNLAGGVCSGDGCGPGRLAERLYRITLNEAQAGLAVIDNGGGRLLEGDIVENVPVIVRQDPNGQVHYRIEERTLTEGGDYSYEVRLSAAPTANVTVAVSSSDTAKATITTGSSLTFTPSNWATPQTVTVSAADNEADSADVELTVTHAVTGAGNYASIADVAHALVLVDDDPTEVSMAGTGVRTSNSGTEISEVMVEGDATRVDRSLTISLGRALTANEWVRVPLYLEATGHRNNPDEECVLNSVGWSNIPLNGPQFWACDVVSSVRGPRYSANVAWPIHHNDFEMAATGAGVSVEAVNRYTPAHVGFRWLEFAGAGAQTATIELKARDGFDDGDAHDEKFHISFPRGLQSVRSYTDDGTAFLPQRHLNPRTNLGGGVTAAQADAHAWYGIADDDAAPQSTAETVEVPLDWTLLPSGVGVGDTFRLLYVTNGETAATSRQGSTYDNFVRAEITGTQLKGGGVPELVPHAASFFGLVTTLGDPSQASTNGANRRAQFRPDTNTHPDDPIYWVGGDKAADDKADFADGTWDSESPRHADGTAATVDTDGYWTGGGQDGHRTNQTVCSGGTLNHNRNQAGEPNVHVGKLDGNDSSRFSPLGPTATQNPTCNDAEPATEMRPIYALSTTVFEVTGGAVEITPRATAAEGEAVAFTVTMSEAAPAGGITVPYTFDHGLGIATDPAHTVADNNDFTDTDSDVTIAQGDTTATITVATTDDSTYEGDHYFRVTLGTPTGTDAPGLATGKHTGVGIITDTADKPTVAFTSATASAAENAGTVDVTVTKTGTTAVPLSVYWTTADGTAAHPTDYTAQSGYLEFATGDTTKTLTIGIVDDNTAENTETFKVQLDGTLAVAAQVGSTGETTITLTDDDGTGAPVSVAMSASDGDSDGNAVEGGAGTTGYRTVTITLGRALAASEEVTVPLSVAGATVADDFTFGLHPTTQTGVTLNTSGSNSAQDPAVVFASGASSATLRLAPVDNNVRTQPYVIVDYGTGARAPGGSGGVTLGTPTGGPVGVVLVDDETGDIVLPPGTAFRPAVFNNAEYRLMFMTSAGGAATSTDIADYDHFVRAAAVADGVEGLLPYVGFFKAFVSTASVDGREHVGIWDPALRGGSGGYTDGTTRQVDQGTGIRWLHGETAASDYFDACSRAWQNRWSSSENYIRHEDGSAGDGSKVWTGMNNDCTTSSNPLGTATPTYGPGVQAGSGSHSQALSLGTEAASSVNRFYAVSDAFKSVASAAMPAVELTSRSISGNEGDAATARLRVSPAPTDDLTVTYSLSEVAATAGEDFTAGQATVTVPAGQTSVSFDVAILQDNVFEDSETFRITLVPSPDYLIGTGRNSATSTQVTILDDEILKVGFAQSEYWAREDGGSVDVDLTLSHHTEQAVNLMLAFGGTATDGSDYTAPAASVRIPAGNTSGTHTVTIPITADATQEPDETIVVSIDSITMSSRVSEANRSETTVFIADQDHTTPGLVVPATVEVDEGGTATYWLRLATAPSGTVTVTVSGQTAATLTLDADDSMPNAQNSVQFDASNWFVGRKVTVRGVHDADLTDDSVTLAHSASGADYGSVTGSVTASVDDEDVTLSITPGAAVTEGTAAEFTVTANPAPERDLTVNVGIADASGADFVAANQQGNRTRRLSAGQSTATFTVPTVADFNVEPSGPITITLRTSDHYRIDSSAASAEVQVNDDDAAAVAVAMSGTDGDADGNAVEGASNSTGYRTITLTLGGPLSGSETLTVPLSVTGATVTTDYTFALQPPMQTGVTLTTTGGTHTAQDPAVVFTAGATTATLRLTPVDNNVRSQPYVIVDFGSGATASGGINVGEQTGGPINVVFVDDETGDIEVAADWALAPSGLSAGDEFRLIFITSQFRTATSTDIDDYNDWARQVVAEHGHAALLPYSGMVSVIGSTTTVDARENTAMWDPALNSNAGGYTDSSTSASGAGTAVYWLAAPSAQKVADNYFDFYDASWDTGTNNSNHSTDESGGARTNIYWTGSSDAGVAVSGHALGESPVRYGHVNTSGNTPLNHGANAGSGSSLRLLAMSPVFKIDPSATGPEVSVRLMVGEGENRNADGEVEKPEVDATVSFPLSLDTQPAADMTVCVSVAESGDVDRVAPADEGIKAVPFLAGVQTGSIDVAWTDTADDDLDSVITVTAVPSNTVGCTSSDVYTVSGAHGSEKVRITDDEATEVTLTSSDTQMQEQDTSDTATLTVSSGRALVAGESLVARITLATSTMARLPDHATPDFAVTATGTGVVLTSAATTTPLLTFTGSDSGTVQTATVTLTPIATADDADTADETVTAALSLITGTGSGTVVTGGGVEVGSSSTATLTIDDDDTSNCAAQNTVFSVSDLRVTEMGGVATYCVRLTTAPSGGQTTVAVGTAAGTAVFDPSTFTVIESVSSGAATVSPSSLTFTASNYTEPQQVTVTATDEPGDNRNRRFNLTHTASGGGYSSQALGAVPVLVTDAPELEVFEYRRTYDEAAYNAHKRAHDGWGIFRPNTLTSTPGLGPAPDITPGEVLDYFVRLSAQPAGEVEVTVNVTDVAGYDADTFTGISFTPGGSPQQSLTFTFHDGDPTAAGCSDGRNGGDRYTQTRISWKCYRVIWVHNTRSLYVEGTRCADVVHSATGGGFRTATVPTMRAFSLGMVYGNWPKEFLISQYRDLDSGSFYRLVYFSKQTPGGPYTWHMRPWSGGPLVTADTLNLETVYTHGGQLHQPADCPLLRRQYINQHTPQNSPSQDGPLAAQAPPEPTTAVANLTLTAAGGASVDVVWDAVTHADKYLVAYSAEAADGTAQSAGVFDGITATAWTLDHGITAPATVTVTVTPGYDTDGGTTAVYLDSLAATAAIDTGSTAPSVVPEIAIAAGADVTEGGDATFTVTASPAPAAGLDVIVEVAQSGDFATTGTQTVTIPTSGTYTLVVATANDDTDEADGTITATVNDGAGYSVSGAAAAASVAVSDNDPPPDCVSDKTLELARDYYELNRHRAPGYGRNWRRVLIAFGDITDTQLEAFTAAEARQSETRWAGWRPFRQALECIEQAQQDPAPPPAEPEIAITAGNDVAEGSDATFTITAAPAPAAGLDITVEVAQTGDFATTGTQTITIPTSGAYTLVVATTDDTADEPEGSVTATIGTGTGYSVSTTNSAATVNVSDDDDPPPPATPEISIAAGTDVTEGGDAVFTITADPKPHADLDVAVEITQSGAFVSTGARTVTIGTTGTATLTVATTDDNTDEADGSVTATVSTGTGYTISSSSSAAVNVSDDDVPEITITAGTDVTEGGDAIFTITADPAPHTDLDVTIETTQTGDYGADAGTQTVTIPATGTYTLTVATADDSADEADGAITATINTGAGYTVSATAGDATVAVSDNDDPPPEEPAPAEDPPADDPAPTGPPTLSVSDATAQEGDPGGLRFTVTVSPAADEAITLGYGAFGRGAAAGSDFTIPYKTFTLNPGDTQLDITLPVTDDNDTEPDETLTLYLYATSGITIPGYFLYATGTITDND